MSESVQEITNTAKGKAGRPHRYTPDQISDLVDSYIKERVKQEKPITRVGFAVYIGMSKDAVQEMGLHEDYAAHIKRIDTASEDFTINYMFSAKNPAGAIFYAKNIHGYTDKQEITQTNNINISLPADRSELLKMVQAAMAALPEQTQEAITVEAEAVEVLEPPKEPTVPKGRNRKTVSKVKGQKQD